MYGCCSWVKGERKVVFQRGCGRTQGCGDFRARRITSFSKDMRFDLGVLTRPDFRRQVGCSYEAVRINYPPGPRGTEQKL